MCVTQRKKGSESESSDDERVSSSQPQLQDDEPVNQAEPSPPKEVMPKRRRQAQAKGKVEVMGMDHQNTAEINNLAAYQAIKEGFQAEKEKNEAAMAISPAKFKKQRMDEEALPEEGKSWANEVELNNQEQKESAATLLLESNQVQVTFQDSKEVHAKVITAWDLEAGNEEKEVEEDRRVIPTLVQLSAEDLKELAAWKKKKEEEKVREEEVDGFEGTVAKSRPNSDAAPLTALQVRVLVRGKHDPCNQQWGK